MTENTTSVAETNAVLQDKQGFMWFGGSNGLVRYDTHKFISYTHDPKDPSSLSNNFVWDLLEDRAGNLWIATNNGLNRFEAGSGTFIRYAKSAQNPNSLVSNDVYRLFEDSHGQLWIGTREGLARFDPTTEQFRHFTHDPADPGSLSNNSITALFEDAHGSLWVGTRGGLNVFDPVADRFFLFSHPDRAAGYNAHAGITDVTEDRSHNLWLATNDGLFRFNRQTGQARHYVHDPENPHSLSDNLLYRLTLDREGNLWVATDHKGLNLYRPASDDFIHYRHDPYDSSSIASDQVRNIFQDRTGDYWVALFPSGVDFANRAAAEFTVYRHDPMQQNSLNHDAVLAIHPGPEGKVWVGTEGGLALFDPEEQSFKRYAPAPGKPGALSGSAVLAIEQDKAGHYWFGTWSGGLNRLDSDSDSDSDTGTFVHYKPRPGDRNSLSSAYVWSLLGDSQGRLWIGTEAGDLDRLDPGSSSFTHFTPDPKLPGSLSGGFIRAIVEDSEGAIWVGTLKGLNRYDETTNSFVWYQHAEGDGSALPHNSIAAIFEDSQQRLWIGTESGLARMDKTSGTFVSYTREQGLINDSIMGIAEDADGNLWLNTLNGLSRFDPKTETFTSLNKANGLAGNIMNRPALLFDEKGRLFVGSTKGLTVFKPERVHGNTFVPPVYFTGFKIFNEEVKGREGGLLSRSIQSTQSITLNAKQNMFTLEFAALSYRDSAANRYRYRMSGFDQQWIDSGNVNTATYTNLNPGKYTFTVLGANNSGVWNEEGRSMEIVVLPPLWRTWWAYLLYGLMLLLLVYFFVRSQLRKVEFEKQKVAQLKMVDRLKDQFLANTSHELRTPLNGIVGLTECLLDHESDQLNEKTQAYLQIIAASGRRLSNLINDILDFSRIKNSGLEIQLQPTNLSQLIRSVCLLTAPLATKKQLELLNEVQADLPTVMADADRLQQILYNLIGNAIKFTAVGRVRVYASRQGEMLRVCVEDTGIGIRAEEIDSIFESFTQGRGGDAREYEGTGLGLAVAKNLVELHGGEISVSSRPDEGSTFCFTLAVSGAPAESAPESETAVAINTVIDEWASEDNEALVTDAPHAAHSRFHILVVDDERINRQVLSSQLALHHYRVSEAGSGHSAIEMVESDPSIDLILMDVMMPRMSGYDAARHIRGFRPVHELPIIFVTAKHMATDLVTGFVSGGNDFLVKPVSKNELLSRTKTHLMLLDATRNLERLVEERTNTLKEAQRSLESVDNIVNMINKQSSLDGLARIMLRESTRLIDACDSGAFWILDESGATFSLISTIGGTGVGELFPQRISKSLLHDASRQLDLPRGARIVDPKAIKFVPGIERRIDSALVMNIEIDGELTAILALTKSRGAGRFSDRDVALCNRLESHAITAVSKAKLLETLKRQNQRLEQTSYSDHLTGLYNRRHLMRYMPGDLALCKRRYEVAHASKSSPFDADLLFILLDIDHFKAVNDTHGHNAGDLLLKQFAQILKAVFRESDHIIRWGGEEFLVVVRFFDRTQAAQLAERFRAEVELSEFDVGNGVRLKKTCSLGFSCYPFYPASPQAYTWEQVLEIADKCLYAAKKTSRNAWVGAYGNLQDGPILPFQEAIGDFPVAAHSTNIDLCTSFDSDRPLVWD